MTERQDLRCVLSGPLSANTGFSLTVIGPWGEREARNLVRLLELQVEWLAEDEREVIVARLHSLMEDKRRSDHGTMSWRMALDRQVIEFRKLWQPITSAPRDGSHFLARGRLVMDEYDEDRLVRQGVVERCTYVAYFCFGDFVSFPFSGGIPENLTFTHWQPLPEPPEE